MRWAALALLLASGTAFAAGSTIQVDGRVSHTLTLDAAALAKLPQTSVDVSFDSAHGKVTGHFTGVLLWDVLNQAEIKPDPAGQKHHLQDTIVVTGSDGYSVAVAEGEIDPMFEGKQVIIGHPAEKPDDAPRLVVPDDKMAGRAVKDVVRIEVQ